MEKKYFCNVCDKTFFLKVFKYLHQISNTKCRNVINEQYIPQPIQIV